MVAHDGDVTDDFEPQHENEVVLRCKLPKGHDRSIMYARFTKAKNRPAALVTVGHDSLKIWDVRETSEGELELATFFEAAKWRCGVQNADASADGSTICLVGIDSVIYKVNPGVDATDTQNIPSYDFGYMESWFLALLRDRNQFVSASFSGKITIVSLDGQIVKQEPFKNMRKVSAMAASPSGNLIAFATLEGVVSIFDTDTLKEQHHCEVHSLKIRAIAFSPKETTFATGCEDKTIKIFNFDEETRVLRNLCGHRAAVVCIRFDERSDGNRMASSSLNGEILLWDVEAGVFTHKLPSPHESTVHCIAFHPNGRHFVSVGEDRMIALYQIPQSGNPYDELEETAQHDETQFHHSLIPTDIQDEIVNSTWGDDSMAHTVNESQSIQEEPSTVEPESEKIESDKESEPAEQDHEMSSDEPEDKVEMEPLSPEAYVPGRVSSSPAKHDEMSDISSPSP